MIFRRDDDPSLVYADLPNPNTLQSVNLDLVPGSSTLRSVNQLLTASDNQLAANVEEKDEAGSWQGSQDWADKVIQSYKT